MKKWLSVAVYSCLLVYCYAEPPVEKRLNKGSGTNPKQLATDAITLSKSPKIDDRIQSANLIAFFPSLISSKTEIEVITSLAADSEPVVRIAALGGMQGLVEIALIKPLLPLAKSMEDDPNKEVSDRAKAIHAFMKAQNAMFERQGVTEEQVRKRAFTGGIVPELY